MRIVELHLALLTSPYRTPQRLRSYGVVVVKSDDGRIGVGEPYAAINVPTVCREAIEALKPLFIGQDAEWFEAVVAHAHAVAEYFDHRGMMASLIGAIDWALHDLAAQRANLPLHRFLNADSSDSAELYASTGLVALSHEQLREEIHRRIEQGYRTIKIRIGCGIETPEQAIERARIAADAVGSRARLGIDAGQQIFVRNRRSVADAMRVNDALGELKLLFYEDPFLITDRGAYQVLQKMQRAPIAGGEMFNQSADFELYCQSNALDIAQPDACVLPGPSGTIRAMEIAARHSAGVFMHGWAGPVAQMQNIHAALASQCCDLVEFCPLLHPLMTDGLAPIWNVEDGRLAAPAKVGMGAAPIGELVAKYPFQNIATLIA